jgi:hypothetical protein
MYTWKRISPAIRHYDSRSGRGTVLQEKRISPAGSFAHGRREREDDAGTSGSSGAAGAIGTRRLLPMKRQAVFFSCLWGSASPTIFTSARRLKLDLVAADNEVWHDFAKGQRSFHLA